MPGLEVVSVCNAAAIRFKEEIILLLRVGERVAVEGSFPNEPYTLNLFDENPSPFPLKENIKKEETVSFPWLDLRANPPQIRIVFIPKSTPGLDCSRPRFLYYKSQERRESEFGNKKKIIMLEMSHLRLARSQDGIHFKVEEKPSIIPQTPPEEYGCEDARITEVEGVFYITYVSVSRFGMGTSLLTTTDFISFKRQGVIFPPDNKDVVIFPKKIQGKFVAFTRPMPESFDHLHGIWIAYSPDLRHWGDYSPIVLPRLGFWDEYRTGAGAVPFLTKEGWVEIYHGSSNNNEYSLGALLLDIEEPSKVIARSKIPILKPTESFESSEIISRVVFTCGVVALDNEAKNIRIFYGGGDKYIAGADVNVQELLDELHRQYK